MFKKERRVVVVKKRCSPVNELVNIIMPKLKFKASVTEMKVMYRSPWGQLRQKLLREQLSELHRQRFRNRRGLRLLDIGPGLGQYSSLLLRRGWQATLLDPSEEMLAACLATLRGISNKHYELLHDDARLLRQLAPATYDLVMAHVLIEYLDEPMELLKDIKDRLKKKGLLSLVYNQTSAAALFRIIRGKPQQAEAILKDGRITNGKMGPCRTFSRKDINEMLDKQGYTILEEKGLRVYCDYLPNRLKMAPDSFRKLLRLERRASIKGELLPLARMIHVVARKS